jgi:hypothetical protein
MPGLQSQLLHEDISCGGHQHTKLIGHKFRATGSVYGQAIEQLLNPILYLTAIAVHFFIQDARGVSQVGYKAA